MNRIINKLGAFALIVGIGALPSAALAGTACKKAASFAHGSCTAETRADLSLESGKCVNSDDKTEVRECKADALESFREAKLECRDQHEARVDLCRALDEDVYAPVIDPANFVATIDNPYAPFPVGGRWVYQKDGEEGVERVEVEVLDETRTILGVTTRVVRDREFLDDELIEDTVDWLAQDADGNVWYFGELSYEVEDGVIVSIEGSWEAGVDGAQPGLWMKANPQIGDVYRQEFLLGEAEDYAEVLSLTDTETVPEGTFTNCLRTRDATPLEPDAEENKLYAPGVGLVVEIDVESGERTELIELDLP